MGYICNKCGLKYQDYEDAEECYKQDCIEEKRLKAMQKGDKIK